MLADSLAVAAQTLLARSLAAGQQAAARVVIGTTMRMSLALGCVLTAALALGADRVVALFSSDPAVLAVLAVLMPGVVRRTAVGCLAAGRPTGLGGVKEERGSGLHRRLPQPSPPAVVPTRAGAARWRLRC